MHYVDPLKNGSVDWEKKNTLKKINSLYEYMIQKESLIYTLKLLTDAQSYKQDLEIVQLILSVCFVYYYFLLY